ncbi:hypothetical protein OHA98_12975 [Streptomyces sp. NBC_00654]|uniref:hypothetical protein n=1 Tax=Streptomyces sp. NBC_00654 TaxID=2975799 RepID=UPI002251D6AE|nr:hypothetical protein [Streptomyces sp. NBC_00654]MCX4965738.1 hypothetical protein [Streptomyces sp. NBC_00654]
MNDERRQTPTLRDIAGPLAKLLWRQHTVYRERGGTVVIRGEDAGRWISLTAHGLDRALVRTGRILDGGTTAPARAETIAPLDGDIARLAACCRGLLAETADTRTGGARTSQPSKGRPRRRSRSGRRRPVATALICLALVVGLVVAFGGG